MTVRLLVIVGPTACGKTRLGVQVAHRLHTEIISADSRQVYRRLDIGSGKDLSEYSEVTPPVPYHLIDVEDPDEIYSVFHYQRDCYKLLSDRARHSPFRDGTPLVMVGGSGLYIEAVLRKYRIPNVPEDVELRRQLATHDHEELVEELRRSDPELAARTDCTSKKRVIRALEIANAAAAHPVQHSSPPPIRIDYAVFGIDVPREELHRRIDTRLDARLEEGLIDEVKVLLESGVTPARMDLLGLEYREVTAYLIGKKTKPAMIEDLRQGIHRFAKRQKTWFRGFRRRGIEVRWIHPEDADALLQHAWS